MDIIRIQIEDMDGNYIDTLNVQSDIYEKIENYCKEHNITIDEFFECVISDEMRRFEND